jgi:hypothetical protein
MLKDFATRDRTELRSTSTKHQSWDPPYLDTMNLK